MASIADKLAQLFDPTPSIDPEDENEESSAKVIEKADLINDEENGDAHLDNKSKLRNPISAICFEEKYAGKVVSRINNLDDFSNDEEDENEEKVESHILDSDNIEDRIEKAYEIEDVNEDLSSEDELISSLGYNDDDDDDEEILSDEAGDVQMFRNEKPEEMLVSKKGDTKFQISMNEKMLETRIKLQKLLVLSNKLPRSNTHEQFTVSDDNVDELVSETSKSLSNLCGTLLSLQTTLYDKINDENMLKDINLEESKFNAKKLDDHVTKRCMLTRNRRNKTLNYWYDKTKLLSNKVDKSFSTFERPVVEQIEQILADRERLIKRTRTKRSDYYVLGSKKDGGSEKQHDSHLIDMDIELFDDDDFYQQLLQQFIQQKTMASSTDSQNLNRQWLKVQRMHSKIKKTVDTKASKGRKVRYHVHPKLVSFMSSHDKSTWSHDSRNQLVRSVFGKTDVK